MSVSSPGSGLGTVLGVWAHPDDEAYLSSGLMAQAAASGSRVVCVNATRGEGGSLDPERWPPESLGDIRAPELQRCLTLLGVEEYNFPDLLDVDWHTPLRDAFRDGAEPPVVYDDLLHLDLQLDRDLLELKVAAIYEPESQIAGLAAPFGQERWTRAMARESFRCVERRPG